MRCSTACGISTALLFFLEAACAALCAFCLGGMAEEQGNQAWLGDGQVGAVQWRHTGGSGGGGVQAAAGRNAACAMTSAAYCECVAGNAGPRRVGRAPVTAPCRCFEALSGHRACPDAIKGAVWCRCTARGAERRPSGCMGSLHLLRPLAKPHHRSAGALAHPIGSLKGPQTRASCANPLPSPVQALSGSRAPGCSYRSLGSG